MKQIKEINLNIRLVLEQENDFIIHKGKCNLK